MQLIKALIKLFQVGRWEEKLNLKLTSAKVEVKVEAELGKRATTK